MYKVVKFLTILILFILSTISVFCQESIIEKNKTIMVVAPEGTTEKVLGMGFDEQFNELSQKVINGEVVTTKEATYQSTYTQIENTTELVANAKIFSLIKIGTNNSQTKRYATLSIYYIDKTISIQPSGKVISSAPFYASKIHYGWSLNYIITGESSRFNTEVSTILNRFIGLGGELSTLTSTLNLSQEMKLKGLTGRTDGVVIAKSPEETLNKFKRSIDPVPILIEYKAVNNINTTEINWEQSKFIPGKYILKSLSYEISNRKSNGKNWDVGFGGKENPDVIIEMYINGQKVQQSNLTKDVLRGTYYIEKTLDLNDNSIINFVFIDKDMSENDMMGTAILKFRDLKTRTLDNYSNYIELNSQNPVIKKCTLMITKTQ